MTEANGDAEREAALRLLDRHPSHEQRTLAADKAYDTKQFVADCRERGVTPQVAMNISGTRRSAIDARTARHAGYLVRSADPQAGRRMLRLGQGRAAAAQDEGLRQTQRRVPRHADDRDLHVAEGDEAPGATAVGAFVGEVSLEPVQMVGTMDGRSSMHPIERSRSGCEAGKR